MISPGDNDTDVEDQGFDWLEAGTRLVMAINPRRHVVTVYRSLAAITLLLETDVLDGGEWYPIGQSLSETYVNNGESTRRAS